MGATLLGSISLVLVTGGALYVLLTALALEAGQVPDPLKARQGMKIWGSVAAVGLVGIIVSLYI